MGPDFQIQTLTFYGIPCLLAISNFINQQLSLNYLLDAFCSHWDFCSSPHLQQDLVFNHGSSSLSSPIPLLMECTYHTPDDTVLVYDLCAAAGLTPFKSDFFDYDKCSIPVCNIQKINEVIGIGTIIHKFVDTKGQFVNLPQVAHYLPSSDVCLFGPQDFHQNGGVSRASSLEIVKIYLTNWNEINIPIYVFESNSPVA